MNRGSTLTLRIAIVCIGLAALAFLGFVVPSGIRAELEGDFDYGYILVGLCLTAIPFLVALLESLKLIGYIDANKAFSPASVQTLKRIKYCALVISGLFVAGMPYIFYLADKDDAPGVAALGFIIIGVSFVIGAAAGVFQRLLQNAIDIKSENDLTV